MCAVALNVMCIAKNTQLISWSHQIIFLLTLLAIVRISSGVVDCRTACRKCHDNTDAKQILEVYCAMCEECKLRRREKLEARTKTETPDTTPSSSPSPPNLAKGPASEFNMSDEEESANSVPWTKKTSPTLNPNYNYIHQAMRSNIKHPVYPAGCPTPPVCSGSEEEHVEKLNLPTMTTPPTTTTTACPPIQPCRKKKKKQQLCFPCMPMCPCPTPSPVHLAAPTTTEFYRVYVGVPKNLLRY